MLKPIMVGIWLDYRHADIFLYDGSRLNHKTIEGYVVPRKTRGGSSSGPGWGPQQVVSESKQMYRRDQDIEDYYESILREVPGVDAGFVLFGPAAAKKGLNKYIKDQRNYRPGVLKIVTKDKMTINQKKAFILDAYSELLATQII